MEIVRIQRYFGEIPQYFPIIAVFPAEIGIFSADIRKYRLESVLHRHYCTSSADKREYPADIGNIRTITHIFPNNVHIHAIPCN